MGDLEDFYSNSAALLEPIENHIKASKKMYEPNEIEWKRIFKCAHLTTLEFAKKWHMNYCDIFSNVNLSLHTSMYSFDPSKNVPFYAWAKMNMRAYAKNSVCSKYCKNNTFYSLDSMFDENYDIHSDFLTDHDIEFYFDSFHYVGTVNFKKIIECLTDKQKKIIFDFFWDGKTKSEIARSLRTSFMVIDYQIKVALKKLRGLLAQEFGIDGI